MVRALLYPCSPRFEFFTVRSARGTVPCLLLAKMTPVDVGEISSTRYRTLLQSSVPQVAAKIDVFQYYVLPVAAYQTAAGARTGGSGSGAWSIGALLTGDRVGVLGAFPYHRIPVPLLTVVMVGSMLRPRQRLCRVACSRSVAQDAHGGWRATRGKA